METTQVQIVNGFRKLRGDQPPPCEHDTFEVLRDRSFYEGGPTIDVLRCTTCGKEAATRGAR